jgi:hypothetical protein
VEIALAAMAHCDQYRGVSVNSAFATRLNEALRARSPFGSNYNDIAGAFPLSAANPVTSTGTEWDQWTTHAENIAKVQGFNTQLAAGLLGALKLSPPPHTSNG